MAEEPLPYTIELIPDCGAESFDPNTLILATTFLRCKWYGMAIISLRRSSLNGKVARWIRITIPAESFEYFQEQNYARTPVPFDDFAEHILLGLQINPESKTGNVVRSYLLGQFDSSVPEEFKEMALSIRRVVLRLKP